MKRERGTNLDAARDAPNDGSQLGGNDSEGDDGAAERSQHLAVVPRLGRLVVACSHDDLAMLLLELREDVLLRGGRHESDERVEAGRDLACVQNCEGAGRHDRDLRRGDLALFAKHRVEGLAVGSDPFEDERHLGVRSRWVGLEELRQRPREPRGECRALGERSVDGQGVHGGSPLFDDRR